MGFIFVEKKAAEKLHRCNVFAYLWYQMIPMVSKKYNISKRIGNLDSETATLARALMAWRLRLSRASFFRYIDSPADSDRELNTEQLSIALGVLQQFGAATEAEGIEALLTRSRHSV